MKSLLERPFYLAAVVAIIAVAAILWWLLGPQASTVTTTETVTNTNAPVLSAAQRSDNESATATATSEITPTHTVAPVTTANVALPTDPALAEEELDRLNDEHARLNDRKSQLAQQLEISNKLLAMKEQQVKTLETTNH